MRAIMDAVRIYCGNIRVEPFMAAVQGGSADVLSKGVAEF